MEDKFEMDGIVKEMVPGGEYIVLLSNNHRCLCKLSGKMIKNSIRLSLGDSVTVEISKYDITRGRVIYRKKRAFPQQPS